MPTLSAWIIRHYSGGAWAGQYFFLILLQLIALFALIRWLYTQFWLRVSIILSVALLYILMGYAYGEFPQIVQKLNIRPCIYHLPYVFTGIALANGDFPKMPAWLCWSALLVPIEFLALSKLGLTHDPYITPSVLFSSILISAIVAQHKIDLPDNSKIRKIVGHISRNTLTIFVANPLIIYLFAKLIPNVGNSNIVEVILSFITATSVLVICLGVAQLLKLLRLKGILY